MFNKKQIFIGVDTKTRDETLRFISEKAVAMGFARNPKSLFQGFVQREKQGSTGFEKGFAIPHVQSTYVQSPVTFFVRLKSGVDWQSLDGKPAKFVFAIMVPRSKAKLHLDKLAKIARLLLNESFVSQVTKATTAESVLKTLNFFMNKPLPSKPGALQTGAKPKNTGSFRDAKTTRVVAVTACPTGVAHTNMAADALEDYAHKHNIQIKVERQAAQDVVNKLTSEDIILADYVIIASGRAIDGKGRFNGKRTLQVSVQEPLRKVEEVFQKMKTAPILKFSKARNFSIYSTDSSGGGTGERVSVMIALMTGLSYMIPVVVVGGLFLAISLGASGGKEPAVGTFFYPIYYIGLAGLNLMIVILGAYIAFAIAGRAAIAPAAILSFILNGGAIGTPSGTNPFFFSYKTFEFGVHSTNLGFFGAIAVGLLIGYTIREWNKAISPRLPKSLKTVEPILMTPILFTFAGWLIFAFLGYLPLFYLADGLSIGVKNLIRLNLLWIAGGVLGAMMCFDLGGPVNKIAFGIGVVSLGKGINHQPVIMGMVAAAGSVPPLGLAIGYLLGRHVFRIKEFNNDYDSANTSPAFVMGCLGITEGAIPYTIRHPKSCVVANISGGIVASALAGVFQVTDLAPHTGPIVYVVGAIGKNGVTNYAYGLFYLLCIGAGVLTTALLFPGLELLFQNHHFNKITNKFSNLKFKKSLGFLKRKNFAKQKIFAFA